MSKITSNSCTLTAAVWAFVVCMMTTPAAFSQIIITNFPGVSLADTENLGTGATPPDTMGAAGPNHFAEFINGAFAVYQKNGTRIMLISDIDFWLNAGISSSTITNGLTDTRIAYDPPSGRWFASQITAEPTGNHMLVGRSDTSDPSGTWQAVFFTATSGGYDYDTLGVDANAVYLGANLFNASGNFIGVAFFSIPKADMIASPPSLTRMTRFNKISSSTYGFTLQPVSTPLGALPHGVVMAIDDVSFGFVDRTTVNNPGGAGATLSTPVRITISDDSNPNPAAQPGVNTVDTIDDRFTGAARLVGTNIFLANTIFEGSHDAVHWLVLTESNNTVLGEGLIGDSTYDYFQPTIAANPEGRIVLGFNRSGSTAPSGDISIYGALGSINGSSVTMGSPFLISQGAVDNFGPSFDSAPYRWGDYSATTLDPTDDNLFWTIQEIPVDDNTWGTEITLLSLATNVPTLAIAPAGQNVLVSWPLSTDPAYALQSATVLSPGNWGPVATSITASFNQNVASLAIIPPQTFFRLKK